MTRRLPTVLAAALVGWAAVLSFGAPWAGDTRIHLATLHALIADPWSPADPLVGLAEGSPYYSPYAYLLALTAKAGGFAPITVLRVAGVLNVALWLWALARFTRRLGGGARTTVLAVVFCLLLWGLHPQAWSGFTGLYSLSWTMAYPSLFATALMLLAWDVFLDIRSGRPGYGAPALLALVMAVLVLVHPFTTVGTALGLVAFALADPRATLRRPVLAPAALAAVGLALLWPFSDVTDLMAATPGMAEIHWTLVDDLWADHGLAHYGLALAGLPALVARRNRPLGRELLVLFGLVCAVLAAAFAAGSWGFARTLPVAVLPLHLSLAAWCGERARPRLAWAAVGVACAVGLYGNLGGLTRPLWRPVEAATLAEWKQRDPATGYAHLLAEIRPGDVVAAQTDFAARAVNARGGLSLVPGWPYPWVDAAAREADNAALFAVGTRAADRSAIAARHGVRCVLADLTSPALAPGALPGFALVSTAQGVGLACRA
ncbi:hypothetical protein LO762_06165 [Actinocorallia sp. API 0066]|uniref:hypothetical protein n=1 Tax=Actinocorallia sp. API 0066 TaxID=2896846 RepID=UPI001E61FCA2|nr:hypothetical protein [Actinocorallia sp. API 0066]MCD0448781.1 hypothetical protein [Actinocorallia sp. API 0066]